VALTSYLSLISIFLLKKGVFEFEISYLVKPAFYAYLYLILLFGGVVGTASANFYSSFTFKFGF
jgi:hypothetical protein